LRPEVRREQPGSAPALQPKICHDWDLDIPGARELQERLRSRVVERDSRRAPRLVAGADISFDRKSPGDEVYAAVVVLEFEGLRVVEVAGVRTRARFPYVPGYLSFREIPPLLDAFAKLRSEPDLIVCDGQGRAHPRRFGLACHLGVLFDRPTLGCAKSRLIGAHREPGPRRGAHTQLRDGGEVIGEVVRTRPGVKPIFVSVGHRICIETARRTALRLAPRYRLPEPIRAAHHEVNRLRRLGGCEDSRVVV
jgi:deoxyribonuclease V